ncbi:DNA polymerase delta, subunit 4-domain-containing protein [Gigaspora rosea]|uniref:DNA polymerase delta, subunit 4-domain-containing protein n=1 Tax=Gigaspora rosea TaxID=44941 RepID=A0A397TTR6_9GLOM|nr:DNA polymerase delta, subunit 4-domain-containing protein [Gigaspora rosea]
MPPQKKKPKKYVQQTLTNILATSKRDSEDHKYPNKRRKSSDKSNIPNEVISGKEPKKSKLRVKQQETVNDSYEDMSEDEPDTQERVEPESDEEFENETRNILIPKEIEASEKNYKIVKQAELTFHNEGLSPAEKVLNEFDLNYKYGPCVGLKRLDRWERARKFGLNPPMEVKELLMTTVGLEESIFNGRV